MAALSKHFSMGIPCRSLSRWKRDWGAWQLRGVWWGCRQFGAGAANGRQAEDQLMPETVNTVCSYGGRGSGVLLTDIVNGNVKRV